MIRRCSKFFILLTIFGLIFHINTGPVRAGINEINADEIAINTANGAQEVVAQGSARIKYDTMTFTANKIHYNTDSEDIRLTGNITLTDEDYTIRGETLDGNLGQGEFTIKGDNEQAEINGPGLHATAGVINYNREQGKVIMEQNPVLTYKEMKARADNITYHPQKRTAVLTGNVEGVQENGREFSADRLDVDMETEKIKMSGRANITFKDKNSESKEDGDQSNDN